MKVTRRTLLGTIAAGFAAGPHLPAFAEGDWPSRIVRLVSPYGAGGASDISLRILAEQFGRSLNQQFIVENKPGAGTRVANELVSRAAPDGYTFLYAAAPFATAEALFEKLNYNRKDLQPVAMAMMAPLFLVVNAQAPFKTLQEMIDYGRSKPDGLTFGSPGAGSQPHLAAELLFRDAGVKGLIVPFRGDNMAYTELLASRLDATLTAISTALPHIQSGSCACWVWRRPSAARFIPRLSPCVSRAFPTWSLPAGTASWRRRQRRARSSIACRRRLFACLPIPR